MKFDGALQVRKYSICKLLNLINRAAGASVANPLPSTTEHQKAGLNPAKIMQPLGHENNPLATK